MPLGHVDMFLNNKYPTKLEILRFSYNHVPCLCSNFDPYLVSAMNANSMKISWCRSSLLNLGNRSSWEICGWQRFITSSSSMLTDGTFAKLKIYKLNVCFFLFGFNNLFAAIKRVGGNVMTDSWSLDGWVGGCSTI